MGESSAKLLQIFVNPPVNPQSHRSHTEVTPESTRQSTRSHTGVSPPVSPAYFKTELAYRPTKDAQGFTKEGSPGSRVLEAAAYFGATTRPLSWLTELVVRRAGTQW